MKITHFGHACVLVELQAARLLFDPGTYAGGFEDLTDLDAILITHEHPDHLDADRLAALMKANPAAQLITGPGGAAGLQGIDHLSLAEGDSATVAHTTVRAIGGEHAVIHPDLPCVRNNAYLLDDLLLHPGDAFALPPHPVKVLLLPTGGPWMKVSDSIDYLRAVRPEIAIPIHQAGLAGVHQQLHYQLFRSLAPSGTQVQVLDHAVAASL